MTCTHAKYRPVACRATRECDAARNPEEGKKKKSARSIVLSCLRFQLHAAFGAKPIFPEYNTLRVRVYCTSDSRAAMSFWP